MIQVIDVNKTFGEQHVLKDVTATFETGKVNFIIGRSGSGKSVTTKCIVGLLEVGSGQILYDGRDFTSMNNKERKEIRKEIGMLFQGSALFDSMTVEENVGFPLRMFGGMSEEEMQERINFCLKRVQLEGSNKKFPAEISGGMQKRVGIARAIAMNPKYLFCDEPNSGLDPQTAIVIDNLIQEITYEFKMTTVVVSHDMNSVIEVGDNINFVNKGMIWWTGGKDDILHSSNQELNDFVYASDFMKIVRKNLS
ncbi:MAG: ATP-binding cassette domain-containing protein [Flavobacteriales bacterium]|nr:ATP-binding cassette domain-containing protein [Flavobacteriales bacterium]